MATDRILLHKYKIPPYMHDGLALYLDEGIPPGGFLLAVLENNLKEACARADSVNRFALWHYVDFLYNEAPMFCWGSKERVAKWLADYADKRSDQS